LDFPGHKYTVDHRLQDELQLNVRVRDNLKNRVGNASGCRRGALHSLEVTCSAKIVDVQHGWSGGIDHDDTL
jgi:ribosome assembly protein YihI (activator of Der GTPase)